MFDFGTLAKVTDSTWRSMLSIISSFAIVLSLVLLYGVLSILARAVGSNNFTDIYEQIFVATFLIPGLLASGNYLSKRSKQSKPHEAGTSVSKLQKEIDLGSFTKYVFVFLLGISVSSFLLYERINDTSSVLHNQEQLSEIKEFTRYHVASYYFAVDEYDSITSAIIYNSERKQNVNNPDVGQIWRLIDRADAKPAVMEIYGYADETGKEAENMRLSQKRAEFVSNLLEVAEHSAQVKINVVSGSIIMSSCNKQETENRQKCLAENRRVDVYFSK